MKYPKRTGRANLVDILWMDDAIEAPEGWYRWDDDRILEYREWQRKYGDAEARQRSATKYDDTPTPETKPVRQSISAAVRFRVFAAAKFSCTYCGRSVKDHGVMLVIDHIKPVAKGGTNDFSNLASACWECNAGKGALQLDGDN